MEILKNAGKVIILAEWPGTKHPQQIIEKAGRTCYQSERKAITDETTSKFVKMIISRGHFSVIEHAWIGFIIPLETGINFYKYFWPYSKFLFITEREKEILISGNAETWKKIYSEGLLKLSNLRYLLQKFCPNIFRDIIEKNNLKELPFRGDIIGNIHDLKNEEEILNHIALTIQFNNVSRGLTHELVRHRIPVYSQESTRYVDESNFKVIVPPHKNENKHYFVEGTGFGYQISFEQWMKKNELYYRALRNNGWKPEDARQVLPIATKSQIVVSCNLLEWHYIFKMRTSKFAHWEIRQVMCNLLEKLKERFCGIDLFSDFSEAGKDVNSLRYFELK